MKKNFRIEINKHLKAYNKVELVDSYLVDQAIFCLEEMYKLQLLIKTEGAVHIAQTKFPTKSGRVSSYEAFEKMYISICKELGLSPQSRRQWVKQIVTKKTAADELIK